VVINNFNAAGVPVKPYEADSPLRIDSNAVLALAIMFQGFELVARWNTQEIKRCRRMQLLQLSQRHSLETYKLGNALARKKRLGVSALEITNHAAMITINVNNVNRYSRGSLHLLGLRTP